jgi:hypothetical protein
MTTYSYTITINDGQRVALEAALQLMMIHAGDRKASGAGAPYWAYEKHCTELLTLLLGAPGKLTSRTVLPRG